VVQTITDATHLLRGPSFISQPTRSKVRAVGLTGMAQVGPMTYTGLLNRGSVDAMLP